MPQRKLYTSACINPPPCWYKWEILPRPSQICRHSRRLPTVMRPTFTALFETMQFKTVAFFLASTLLGARAQQCLEGCYQYALAFAYQVNSYAPPPPFQELEQIYLRLIPPVWLPNLPIWRICSGRSRSAIECRLSCSKSGYGSE